MLEALKRAWTEGFSPWVGRRDGPDVGALGETNLPRVRVAGDLAGHAILKAVLQHGHDVGLDLASTLSSTPADDQLDVVIVGAGPAGCAAAAALHDAGRSYVVLDRDKSFHTVDAFPEGKVIYAEPRNVPTPMGWPFEDAPKEALVDAWRAEVAKRGLHLEEGAAVAAIRAHADHVDIDVVGAHPRTLRARHVVIAVGARGMPRKLGVPGEDLNHVHHVLREPSRFVGKKVVVVGGGDTAAEAALQLSDAGAEVLLAHRGVRLDRPKSATREAIEAAARDGRVAVALGTRATGFSSRVVTLDGEDHEVDAAFVLIGSDPPTRFLRDVGLRMRSDVAWSEWAFVSAFVAFVWCFYVLKLGKPWFPFGPGSLAWVHDAVQVTVPGWTTADGSPRVLGGSFWGTLLYSTAILGFGIAAMRRHTDPIQKKRYASLIGFQWVFLFGVPELLAPTITTAASQLYTLGVPWPLSIESLAKTPDVPAAGLWMATGAAVSFVGIPLFVRRHSERFCSWMCGCGGLAETVGDLWRVKAPRGPLSIRLESAGRWILLLAVPVTALIVADAWELVRPQSFLDSTVSVVDGEARFPDPDRIAAERDQMRITDATVADGVLTVHIQKFDWDDTWRDNGWTNRAELDGDTRYATQTGDGVYTLALPASGQATIRFVAERSALSDARSFARGWYGLMVDFMLASFLGVALYPVLGNRVWCRFFCPLRAYMEILAKRFGRLAITADDRCISCGECTTACQMGIDVQGYADKQLVLDNVTSACIQCGICVEVCPMDVLTLVDKAHTNTADGVSGAAGPRWGGT